MITKKTLSDGLRGNWRRSLGRFGAGIMLGVVAMQAPTQAQAQVQTFPSKPVTVIYPYVVGSTLETTLRAVNAEVAKILGKPVLVENRPGANVRLGIAAIQRSPADGYVLSFTPDTVLVHQPLMDKDFHLELNKDYTPITFYIRAELIVVAHTQVPFKDIKGLIAYAKSNPGKLNAAVVPGSITELATQMLIQKAGINLTMIPYKGAGDSITALLGAQIDVMINTPLMVPHIEAGKLIGLATASKERGPILPNAPTLMEAGVPMSLYSWFGIVGPAGMPADVVETLNRAYRTVMQKPEIVAVLAKGNYVPDTSMSAADFGKLIAQEKETWKPILANTTMPK